MIRRDHAWYMLMLGADAVDIKGILKPPHRTKFLANQKTVKTKLHQTLLRGTQVAKHYLSNETFWTRLPRAANKQKTWTRTKDVVLKTKARTWETHLSNNQLFGKDVSQDCLMKVPTEVSRRVSNKSVFQTCPTRAQTNGPTRLSSNTALQNCSAGTCY